MGWRPPMFAPFGETPSTMRSRLYVGRCLYRQILIGRQVAPKRGSCLYLDLRFVRRPRTSSLGVSLMALIAGTGSHCDLAALRHGRAEPFAAIRAERESTLSDRRRRSHPVSDSRVGPPSSALR